LNFIFHLQIPPRNLPPELKKEKKLKIQKRTKIKNQKFLIDTLFFQKNANYAAILLATETNTTR